MKGQVNIEFIISVAIFIIVIAMLSFNIINSLPVFHAESASEIKKSKSFQVSELLVKDAGYPADWNFRGIENTVRIGLTNGEHLILDWNKVVALESYCNSDNYENVLKKLGLESKDKVIINITDLNDMTVMECKPLFISEVEPIFWVYRFGIVNGWIAKIKVAVY